MDNDTIVAKLSAIEERLKGLSHADVGFKELASEIKSAVRSITNDRAQDSIIIHELRSELRSLAKEHIRLESIYNRDIAQITADLGALRQTVDENTLLRKNVTWGIGAVATIGALVGSAWTWLSRIH